MPPRIPKPIRDQSPKPRKTPTPSKVPNLQPIPSQLTNVDHAYTRDDELIRSNPIESPPLVALNFTRVYNNNTDPITDVDLTWAASSYKTVSYKSDKKWTHTIVLYRSKAGELECKILKVKPLKTSKR